MSPILAQAIAASKKLTDHEAAELLPKAQAGDEPARLALLEDCYGFVAQQARNFDPKPCYDQNDLFTVGIQSVERSIQSFDHRSPGTYFRAYARNYVGYAMAKFVFQHQHTIRIPESLRKQRTETGEKVFPAYPTWSLDHVLEDEEAPLSETLVDETVADPSEGVAAKLNQAWLYGAMTAARLTEQERDLLNRLFGLNRPADRNRRSAAKAYGCSRQRMHVRVHNLFDRLRIELLEAERRGRLCLAA